MGQVQDERRAVRSSSVEIWGLMVPQCLTHSYLEANLQYQEHGPVAFYHSHCFMPMTGKGLRTVVFTALSASFHHEQRCRTA